MKLHLLPFGAPAWERRKAIFKGIIAARPGPPYDFRKMLYLAPNERAVRMMRVFFLESLEEETGTRGCIPPAFHALNRFISGLVRRSAGARVAEGIERELVIEDLCRKAAGRLPDLAGPDSSGPSMASLVCAALDRLYTYGADDRRLREFAGDSLPLGFLMEVKGAYEAWLSRHGLSDVSAVMAKYRPKPSDLDYDAVVLDGFYDTDPVEMRVLKALATMPDAHLIVQAPGLRPDGAFKEGTPYHGTAAMIKELCGGTAMCEEFKAYDAEAALFTGALFEGVPVHGTCEGIEALGEKRREVVVAGALNPAEEAYFIAREIKESSLAGNGPQLDRILVYPVTPGVYLPLLREAFTDYGIPFHVSQGRPMAQSPVTAALLDILSLPAEKYSFRTMRRVFASPFVRLAPDGNRLDSFDSLARQEGITGGRQRWVKLTEPGGEDTSFVEPLKKLLLLSGRFSGNKTLPAWAGECILLLEDMGMPEAVLEYKDRMPDAEVVFESIIKELKRMKERPTVISGGIDAARFVRVIRKLLFEKSFSADDKTVSGVRVLGRQEIHSEPFDIVYVCGLSDGALPSPVQHDIFFTGSMTEALGMPSARQSLTRDARLFLSLLLGTGKSFMTWPENSGRGQTSPSPYITALDPFIRSGYLKKEKGAIRRPSAPDKALGPEELLRSTTLYASGQNPSVLPADAYRVMPALARIADGTTAEEAPAFPATDKRRFSVTELEEYILCRYRYYQSRVLRSAPVEDPDEDIAPHEAGSIVHEVLRDFYRQYGKDGLEDGKAALDALRGIAEGRFKRLPGTFVNSEFKRRFMEKTAPRFIETEALFTAGSFRVCATEEAVETELPDGEGGTITLTGKIDRIEMDAAGNFIVADYKTGQYPGKGKPLGKQFQLPVYAYMLKNRDGAKRPAGFVYYNLREGRMRDVVCYDSVVFPSPPGGTSVRRKKSGEEIEEMVARCVGEAVSAARGIISGEFAPNCEDAFVCRTCSYLEVCRKGESNAEDEGVESEADNPDEAK